MEQKGNKVDIPLLGIARSGSDRTCVDGKCNEVIGMEYKDGNYYPYAPTPYTKMKIKNAERVWIHHASQQTNWIMLRKGGIYWTKEETNAWKSIGNVGDFNFDTPINFFGNLIALGNAIYFLFHGDKYIRFTRDDLNLTLQFSAKQDWVYGIRTRYRWDALAGMEKTQSKGFAETICGLYNKLDNKSVEENKLTGACYIRYAFKLYDGSYINVSAPILLKNFDYEKQYYNVSIKTDGLVNIDMPIFNYKNKQYATPLFGTIYGASTGCGEFGGSGLLIGAGVSNLPDGGLSTDGIKFWGLRNTDENFKFGSYNSVFVTGRHGYAYEKNAALSPDIYRDYCSKVYKDQPFEWSREQEADKNTKPVDEVMSFKDTINHLNHRNFNTEEMSCISCIADSAWGTEGLHDWCDVYAFRKASSINIHRSGTLNENLRDFIMSVDVFISRPVLPVETDKQETLDDFQCVEHRKIKDKKVFLDELQTSQRAFYKIMEIPFEDLIAGGKTDFTDKDFLNAAFKNLTSKDELVAYSNHTMRYNTSYDYNQKLHISDFKYELYTPSIAEYFDRTNRDIKFSKIRLCVSLLIDGREYIVKMSSAALQYNLHSVFYYPDARAKKLTIYYYKSSGEYYKKVFDLKGSDVLDYAYFETEDGKSILNGYEKWGIALEDEIPEENLVVTNAINNIMRVSDTGNPIVFPYSFSYQIGNGSIIGMSSNAKALSQGQFGEYNLYVFTTDGIWAMKTDESGKGSYTRQDPVSREVCNNKYSICQIDGGVVFSSEKGLMVISGSEVSLLSEELNGKPVDVDNRVYKTAINTSNLVMLSPNLSDVDFREYVCLNRTIVAFLYKKNKLLIYNHNKPYCYLMDIATKITTKLAFRFDYHISDYPNDKLVSGYSIYDFFIDSDKVYTDTLMQSRPIKLGSHEFKSNYRAVVRGVFDTPQAELVIAENLNLDQYQVESNTVTIEQPEYEELSIQTFNQEPKDINVYGELQELDLSGKVFSYVSLNTYKVGEVVEVVRCDADGKVILDEQGKPTFKTITVTELKDKSVTPITSLVLYEADGKVKIEFKLEKIIPYTNMEITNPVFRVIDKETNETFDITVERTFKDDSDTWHSHVTNIPYKSSYDIATNVWDYEKYSIRSFSFFAGKTMMISVPYIDDNGVVTTKNYGFVVNENIEGEKKITIYLDGNNVNAFNRLTYNAGSGYTTVTDYDGNGKTDGDDILTWIKLFVNNQEKECVQPLQEAEILLEYGTYYKVIGLDIVTYYLLYMGDTGYYTLSYVADLVSKYGSLTPSATGGVELGKDTYYRTTTKPKVEAIKINAREELLPNNIDLYNCYTIKSITLRHRQDFNGERIKSIDGTANSFSTSYTLPKPKYEYIDGQKYAVYTGNTIRYNGDLWASKLWRFYLKNFTIRIESRNEMMQISLLDGESVKIPVAEDDSIWNISTYPEDYPSYAYESYLPVVMLFEVGGVYELAVPYIENGILYGRKYVFQVREDAPDSFDYNGMLVVGARCMDLPQNDPAQYGAKYVDDLYAWLDSFVTNEEYVIPEYSKVEVYDPDMIQLVKDKNYSITTHDNVTYAFKYVEDDRIFTYEDLLAYMQSDKIAEQDEKQEVLFYYYDENKWFTKEEFDAYLQGDLKDAPNYLPYNINLPKGNYVVNLDGNQHGSIVNLIDVESISVDDLLGRMASGYYDSITFVTDDTMIDGLTGNVTIVDKILNIEYSFYSNYADGRISYGELKDDHDNGRLENVWDVDYDYPLPMQNGKPYVITHKGKIYKIIYTGGDITIRELLEKLNNSYYQEYTKSLSTNKHIGLYVLGSIDCNQWGFLGGTERKGFDLTDIITKIERLSVKYIKLVFVGHISHLSHIDGIELQASNKYDNKIR